MIVNLSPWRWTWALAAVVAAVSTVQGQPAAPHLGYVYPAGGRQGETFQVKVGGQYLDGATEVYVSGGGIQAAVVDLNKPLTMKQVNEMRERLQTLLKERKNAAVLAEIAELRKKLATFNRNANPALAETLTVRITAATGTAPGERQLRVRTPLGLSNPLVFCVDGLTEFCEKDPESGPADPEMTVTLPAIVNGRIIPGDGNLTRYPPRSAQQFVPGDVDRYRFEVRQGQQLVIVARARELIPYLADAVPGWFQAVVTLYDDEGRELAFDDDYRFHPDPVLHYEIPRDGTYVLEIRDAIYRGREDFVYRIALGELPFITSIFPLGGPAGVPTTIALKGWNLPATRVTAEGTDAGKFDLRSLMADSKDRRSRTKNQPSFFNSVPFAVDTLPECLEKETNDSLRDAQTVTLPVIVNGRLDRNGDWDVVRFEGRAGDQIVAEVYARRLDSPLDSVLKLTDAAGRQLAFNDDHEDKGSGLNTHHADSFLLATLPADGTWYVHLGDAQQKGGAEYGYRLRLSPPRPDFELRVCPSALNAGAGQTIPISVYALRKDGFCGDITLALKDVPSTFLLSGGVVPGSQDHVPVTLTLPPVPGNELLPLGLEGRATVDRRQIIRQAVPADDMMQAFAYRHLVPATDLRVAVTKRGVIRPRVGILSEPPVKIPAGGTAHVLVWFPVGRFFSKMEFELSDPPEGISVREAASGPRGADLVLQCDAAKTRPGLRGNLIVTAFGERTATAGKAKTNRQRSPLGILPAIPFEVVKP